MRITKTEVYGFRAALRGMRNAKESWAKADSTFWVAKADDARWPGIFVPERPIIGPNDLALCCKLCRADERGGGKGWDDGPNRKFLRQIVVWVDFLLPRDVWQDVDTYKAATVRNSCSTRYHLRHRLLTEGDFEGPLDLADVERIELINKLQLVFMERPTRESMRKMKHKLPESYLQLATYSMSYDTALRMLFWRESHPLPEFNDSNPDGLCAWLCQLPYLRVFYEAAKR